MVLYSAGTNREAILCNWKTISSSWRQIFIQTQLAQMAPDLHVYTIEDDGAPARSTLDPQNWIETQGCMLVTNNRASLPGHLNDHLAQSGAMFQVSSNSGAHEHRRHPR